MNDEPTQPEPVHGYEYIRDAVNPPEVRQAVGQALDTPISEDERVSLPIRMPRMYYEAVKRCATHDGQSMNSFVVAAIGEKLRSLL